MIAGQHVVVEGAQLQGALTHKHICRARGGDQIAVLVGHSILRTERHPVPAVLGLRYYDMVLR